MPAQARAVVVVRPSETRTHWQEEDYGPREVARGHRQRDIVPFWRVTRNARVNKPASSKVMRRRANERRNGRRVRKSPSAREKAVKDHELCTRGEMERKCGVAEDMLRARGNTCREIAFDARLIACVLVRFRR